MQLIDSHCHLDYDYSPKTADDLVSEAVASGVVKLITVGTELPRLKAMVGISERFENVFHTVGVHPHEAGTLSQEDIQTIEAAADHAKCKAIGEIGLDYYYKHSDRDQQIKALETQFAIALKKNLPIVIHARDAEDDLTPALKNYAGAVRSGTVPGVIHCFTGTAKFAEDCLKMGFYISFSGILTFKNADDLRKTASEIVPLNRMLVETDSPYLAPVPMRGKKCEPSMIRHTALKLAELKGVSLDEFAEVSRGNTERVFAI